MTRAQRWRQAFDRIGGPDAVTWPAFWVIFVASLVGNLTTGGSINASIPVRLLVIAATQIVMFIPLVILRFTLLRNPPRPRPWVAIAGFIAAAVLRGTFLSWALSAIGAVEEPLYAYRIAASLMSNGLLFVLLALTISSLRAHTRSLEDLVAGQRDLVTTQEQIIAEVTERNEEALARVKARLTDELTALESTQGAASVAELQRLASDVVRPISHELATALPVVTQHADDRSRVHVTWPQAIGQMAKTSAFRPGQTALVMSALLFVAAIGIFGLMGLGLMAAVGLSLFVLSWLANAALRRLLPRLSAGLGIAAFIVFSVLVGMFSAGAGGWVVRDSVSVALFAVAGGVYLSGLLIIIAMVNAVIRQQRESEEALSSLTRDLRRAVVRLGQTRWLQRKALSRALHGPVQSAVTSAALRLDDAVRSGQPTSDLVTETRTQLRSIIDILDTDLTSTTPLDVALQRIIGTWAGVCEIQTFVADEAADALDRDQLSQSAVIDILTEAVSNAVRHARATRAVIDIACESVTDSGCDISLTVTDNGQPVDSVSAAPGLGTRLLSECAVSWSRQVVGSHHILRATVPTANP